MPALIPDIDTYKDNLDKVDDSTCVKKFKAPGYANPVPIDYFDKVKNGSSIMSHPAGKEIISVFGCKACRWVNTDMCPHKGDVTHMKPHMNRICSQRLQVPLLLHGEGVKMTNVQMLQVRGLMDAEYFSKYVQAEHLAGKRDISDVFPWHKLYMDILASMRKQDEGSKVTVKKEFTPSDLADLIDGAKRVDVEVKEEDNRLMADNNGEELDFKNKRDGEDE